MSDALLDFLRARSSVLQVVHRFLPVEGGACRIGTLQRVADTMRFLHASAAGSQSDVAPRLSARELHIGPHERTVPAAVALEGSTGEIRSCYDTMPDSIAPAAIGAH